MTSISAIPDIIRRSIFISEEENTKKNLHPYNDKYQYFLSGLKSKTIILPLNRLLPSIKTTTVITTTNSSILKNHF